MINLENQGDRQQLVRMIDAQENKSRKALSLMQYEIFNDRQTQYVLNYLRSQFSETTVQEMPIISSINLAKRICEEQASLYTQEPIREFYGVSEEQAQALNDMYNDLGYNDAFALANFYFKGQQQVHVQWVLKKGKIIPRVLLAHHIDVVPSMEDPEEGEIYIISGFDKSTYLRYDERLGMPGRETNTIYQADGFNQKIGDPDDWREKAKRYYVWSKDKNFVMDKEGKIISEDDVNPLEIVPILEISENKDFEYWVRQGQSVTDFSIQFNAMLSDAFHVIRMQGWGQAVFTGPESMMPERMTLGTNTVLRLPIDENNPVPTDFKFVTAGADIMGTLEGAKMLLAMFLSSRGIDPKTVGSDGSGGESFSSGLDRLLSMLSKFEASKQDMALFQKFEQQSFEIIKRYINTYAGTEFLDWSLGPLPEDSYMVMKFSEPQMIQTEKEKLDLIQQKVELGLMSKVDAYMMLWGVDEETAVKALAEIDGETQGPQFRA